MFSYTNLISFRYTSIFIFPRNSFILRDTFTATTRTLLNNVTERELLLFLKPVFYNVSHHDSQQKVRFFKGFHVSQTMETRENPFYPLYTQLNENSSSFHVHFFLLFFYLKNKKIYIFFFLRGKLILSIKTGQAVNRKAINREIKEPNRDRGSCIYIRGARSYIASGACPSKSFSVASVQIKRPLERTAQNTVAQLYILSLPSLSLSLSLSPTRERLVTFETRVSHRDARCYPFQTTSGVQDPIKIKTAPR